MLSEARSKRRSVILSEGEGPKACPERTPSVSEEESNGKDPEFVFSSTPP